MQVIAPYSTHQEILCLSGAKLLLELLCTLDAAHLYGVKDSQMPRPEVTLWSLSQNSLATVAILRRLMEGMAGSPPALWWCAFRRIYKKAAIHAFPWMCGLNCDRASLKACNRKGSLFAFTSLYTYVRVSYNLVITNLRGRTILSL